MKKIILLFSILITLSLAAQEENHGKHHFDISAGYAIPAEMLAEKITFPENKSVNINAAYRYELPSGLSFGVQYGFVPNHNGSIEIVIPGVPGSEDVKETVETFAVSTRYHTINAIVEYKTGPYGPMSMFIGGGGGTQCRFVKYSHKVEPEYYWSANVALYAGLEFFNHLRLSVGHNHDLHVPFSSINSGAPYYYINLGWSF